MWKVDPWWGSSRTGGCRVQRQDVVTRSCQLQPHSSRTSRSSVTLARPDRIGSAIHAYEPNPATFRLLGVNARAYPQIRCHQLVVYAS
jgi:hypothetical protein